MIYLEQSSTSQNTTRSFDLRDHGLLLAHGVFDTSLIASGTMILRSAHLNRLVADAAALGIPVDTQKINDLLNDYLTEDQNGALRITITSGPGDRWGASSKTIDPTILMSLQRVNYSDQFQPISLQTSRIRRNETSPTSRHKTLAYTDNVLAYEVARREGYDDALFLNMLGNVCCTTTGNLFLKFGDTWVTPPISDGLLSGIMRQWMIQTAPSLGLDVIERTISEKELQLTDAAFMMNSLRLAVPIAELNDIALRPELPDGLISALTELITISN